MKEEYKIISFSNKQKRQINKNPNGSKYKLKYTINITILEQGANYTLEYEYPKELSEDEAYKILFDVYLKAAKDSKKTKKALRKILNNSFSILYCTNPENPKDFTFICTPKMDNELLAAVLWIMINNS